MAKERVALNNKLGTFSLAHVLWANVLFAIAFALIAFMTRHWLLRQQAKFLVLILASLFLAGALVLLYCLIERRARTRVGEFRCQLRRPLGVRWPPYRYLMITAGVFLTVGQLVMSTGYAQTDQMGRHEWVNFVIICVQPITIANMFMVGVRFHGGLGIAIHDGGLLYDFIAVPWTSLQRFEWERHTVTQVKLTEVRPNGRLRQLAIRVHSDDEADVRHWLILLTGRLPGQDLEFNSRPS